ncbi:MAG: glycosyltransferase [Proteobacteria bacterium]|nr:glycosyltransferase [Pseudomonadota bacterium]
MSAPGLLFIVNSLETGGAEKHVVTLLNHLDSRRFRLHLAYLKGRKQLLPQLRTEQLASLTCCDVTRRIDRNAVRQLRRIVAEGGIDAIVCTNTYSTLYGRLAARGGARAPRLVAVFHTTVLQTWKQKLQMLLYRRLLNRCDLLVYVCEGQRRYWRERGLHRAEDEVICNGIDTEWFTDRRSSAEQLAFRSGLGFGAEDFVIGICSGLRPEKAHGDLLAAIAKLRAQGIPAKGLLIGEGPQRPVIERAMAQLGLGEHVRITGNRDDVRPFICACDVMTLVSHSETFSLAALESMSLGKPLVISNLGGAGEQVIHGRHGFLFEPGDIEALAMHLKALTSEPLRRRLGDAAALRVRELFTVQRMAGDFTERIQQVLHEPSSAAAHAWLEQRSR